MTDAESTPPHPREILTLVVEDNPGDADLVRELLRSESEPRFTVEHAEDLSAALLCQEERPQQVVLLDLDLPDSLGLDTVRELRQHCPELPMVVLTGADDPELALAALREGADDYVVKGSFGSDLLRRALLYAIERRRGKLALRDEARIVETLSEIGVTLASELRLDSLVQAATDAGTRLAGAAFGAFFYNVISPAGEAYMLYALSGVPREAFASFPMPRATPLFGPTFRGEGGVRIDDVLEDERYGQMGPYHGMPAGHLPVRSYMAVPVVSRSEEVLGGLFFGHPEPARFTARHERLVAGVAAWSAVAMDNARLYDAAQRAIHARDDILSVVSHDLRSPLSAIITAARLLQLDGASAARAEQHLGVIDRSSQAMRRLIDDLLDVAVIERGELALRPASLVAGELIEEACRSFQSMATEQGIRLECTAPVEPLLLWGDRGRLQQVLANLIGNALKFTPAGGTVTVSATGEGRIVRVAVADTGPGLAADALPRVFDRFFHGAKSAGGGVGLGLAICKGIIEAHGGEITVQSVEGDGAAFYFTVPLAAAHQVSATP